MPDDRDIFFVYRWRDMRAGTQDELNVDTDAYKELQKEYDEDQ